MGTRTTDALSKVGAVYCAFTRGAEVLAAQALKCVREVHWLDLGMPEAMWVLEVLEFGPLILAIDSNGGDLYARVAGMLRHVGVGSMKIWAQLKADWSGFR